MTGGGLSLFQAPFANFDSFGRIDEFCSVGRSRPGGKSPPRRTPAIGMNIAVFSARMETELTYLFYLVVLIGLVICPVRRPRKLSRRARLG